MAHRDVPDLRLARSPARLNAIGEGLLPGHLGIVVTAWCDGEVRGALPLRPELFAPHGFVHGATLVALADSLCGYGTVTSLPDGAESFTTVELKSNFFGTARAGTLHCTAARVHGGRSTQVWDAGVTGPDGTVLAAFRCTQLVLWPRRGEAA